MKAIMEKSADAVRVLLPFILFFFICGAYLRHPAKEFDCPDEEIKKERSAEARESKETQPGIITFFFPGGL